MKQTTLQQRIEERSEKKLLKDLLDAANKEAEISNFIGAVLYPKKLNVYEYYDSYAASGHKSQIHMKGEFTKSVFDSLLPSYINQVTDEILQKIDEIDYLVSQNKELQEDLP